MFFHDEEVSACIQLPMLKAFLAHDFENYCYYTVFTFISDQDPTLQTE